MTEPKLIPMHDHIKTEPVQLRLFPAEDCEYEDNRENCSQSVSQLETNKNN